MPSNDARTLLQTALPTAAAGAVAAVISGVVAGGKERWVPSSRRWS